MVGEGHLAAKVDNLTKDYSGLVASCVQLQRELEGYYLRQEAHIRKRVAHIDEIQSCLTEERRCLEAQHQECRTQISAARRAAAALTTEGTTMGDTLKKAKATLEAEEKDIDATIAEISRSIAQEDDLLHQLLDKRDNLEHEDRIAQAKERQQQQEDDGLAKALRDMEGLAAEIEQRRDSLLKKDATIAEWNRSLEARERELVRCQDQLRAHLRQLELDESRHGFAQVSSSTSVVAVVSQREVMDDNDMSIDRENDREEIDLEDEDG